MTSKATAIKTGLQHFHGSETMYQIPLTRTRYTNGIKYLANAAECYWLVMDTSVMSKSLSSKSYFITIDFKRLPTKEQQIQGCEATITYSDGNGNNFYTHKYRVTDFPLEELRLFFVDNTLMLPSEY